MPLARGGVDAACEISVAGFDRLCAVSNPVSRPLIADAPTSGDGVGAVMAAVAHDTPPLQARTILADSPKPWPDRAISIARPHFRRIRAGETLRRGPALGMLVLFERPEFIILHDAVLI